MLAPQLRFAFAFIIAVVDSTTADSIHFSKASGFLAKGTELPLLEQLKGLTDTIAKRAQELSPQEAMQIRNDALNMIKSIETHHVDLRDAILQSEPCRSECGVVPDPFPAKSNLPLDLRQQIAEEQDIPLSYFDAGYVGNVSSRDPRVFGPDAWRTLHRFSIWFPKSPSTQAQTACRNFMQGLPYMIPCAHCGYHLQEFIVLNEQLSGNESEACLGRCTGAEDICRSQAALVDFFARAHNNVNMHNYKSRPNWTASMVYEAYANGSMAGPHGQSPRPWTTQGPVDGKCQLMKRSGENVTGAPTFYKNGSAEDVMMNLQVCAQAN